MNEKQFKEKPQMVNIEIITAKGEKIKVENPECYTLIFKTENQDTFKWHNLTLCQNIVDYQPMVDTLMYFAKSYEEKAKEITLSNNPMMLFRNIDNIIEYIDKNDWEGFVRDYNNKKFPEMLPIPVEAFKKIFDKLGEKE